MRFNRQWPFLDIAWAPLHLFVCYLLTEANWLWQDLDRGQLYDEFHSPLFTRTQREYGQLVGVTVHWLVGLA